MVISRALIGVALAFGLTFGAVFLLVEHYQPTLQYYYVGESSLWLVVALVVPVAVSAALAYTPRLRRQAKAALIFCLAVASAEVTVSMVITPPERSEDVILETLFTFLPQIFLWATSRLPIARQRPWTLLFIGPIAYWVSALGFMLIWILAF